MANEITVTSSLYYANPLAGVTILPIGISLNAYGQQPTLTFNITGKNFAPGSLNASVGGVVVPTSNLTNLGWSMFINQDQTNFVQVIGNPGAVILAKMLPGEPALFRVDSSFTSLTLKAGAGTPLVEYFILEN